MSVSAADVMTEVQSEWGRLAHEQPDKFLEIQVAVPHGVSTRDAVDAALASPLVSTASIERKTVWGQRVVVLNVSCLPYLEFKGGQP